MKIERFYFFNLYTHRKVTTCGITSLKLVFLAFISDSIRDENQEVLLFYVWMAEISLE